MNKADCIDLMTKQLKLIPDENKVIYCYGMSKMALVQDTIEKVKYDQLLFTEFLEFIGRCAVIKYKEVLDMTMEDRLLCFMDELFPCFGVTRKEVEENEEEQSESDPDYWAVDWKEKRSDITLCPLHFGMVTFDLNFTN